MYEQRLPIEEWKAKKQADIGFCGALIGVKLRKMKDAKTKE